MNGSALLLSDQSAAASTSFHLLDEGEHTVWEEVPALEQSAVAALLDYVAYTFMGRFPRLLAPRRFGMQNTMSLDPDTRRYIPVDDGCCWLLSCYTVCSCPRVLRSDRWS